WLVSRARRPRQASPTLSPARPRHQRASASVGNRGSPPVRLADLLIDVGYQLADLLPWSWARSGGRSGLPDHRITGVTSAERAAVAGNQPGEPGVVACDSSSSGSSFRSAGPPTGISTSMTVPLPGGLS